MKEQTVLKLFPYLTEYLFTLFGKRTIIELLSASNVSVSSWESGPDMVLIWKLSENGDFLTVFAEFPGSFLYIRNGINTVEWQKKR